MLQDPHGNLFRDFEMFPAVWIGATNPQRKKYENTPIWFCTLSPQKANIFLQLFFELMVMTVTSYMNEFRFRSTVIW